MNKCQRLFYQKDPKQVTILESVSQVGGHDESSDVDPDCPICLTYKAVIVSIAQKPHTIYKLVDF